MLHLTTGILISMLVLTDGLLMVIVECLMSMIMPVIIVTFLVQMVGQNFLQVLIHPHGTIFQQILIV